MILDSSVFFAASYSATGFARDLLRAVIQGQVGLVLSPYIIQETERNILRKAQHIHPAFLVLRDDLPYQLIDPTASLIVDSAQVVVAKDAPIIAAARAAQVPLVAT